MNLWLKRGLQLGLFTGGLWLVGTGIAAADAPDSTGSAPPVRVAIHAPITIGGNAVNVLGHSPSVAQHTTGASVASGSQKGSLLDLRVEAPVNVTGNAINVLGSAPADASSTTSDAPPAAPASGSS